jgi:hypothetical protein
MSLPLGQSSTTDIHTTVPFQSREDLDATNTHNSVSLPETARQSGNTPSEEDTDGEDLTNTTTVIAVKLRDQTPCMCNP